MRKSMVGDKNPAWKGDNVSYMGIHTWVRNHKGRAEICTACGKSEGRIEWANISGKYKHDVEDYVSLCKPCHAKFDGVAIKMSIVRKSQETYKWLKNYYLGKKTTTYVHEKHLRYMMRKETLFQA